MGWMSSSPVFMQRKISEQRIEEESGLSIHTQSANNCMSQQLDKLSNIKEEKKSGIKGISETILAAKEEVTFLSKFRFSI